MAANKPGIPKGTRDFSPVEMNKRNYIFDTIKRVFKTYGYAQIETPAMENLSTLLGKYGEEGDKLLFKVLNSGDFLQKADEQMLKEKDSAKLSTQICKKGLKYDLTVPFARYVVQHQNEINFPFKRYQIQPVWRADRPQAGRYQEFYQCDVDVIGSDSLLNEIELVQIIDEVFSNLNLSTVIKLNNRKILSGIAEIIGETERIIDITVAIDKLDKIGLEKVNEELRERGLSDESIEFLKPIIQLSGSNESKLNVLKNMLKNSEVGMHGIKEIEFILENLQLVNVETKVEFDLTLARGLNYYTGAIFEVKSLDMAIGSICGGGRYDNLTGIFGLNNVSGVGVSFGADRIFDVLNEKDLYPKNTLNLTQLLFTNFGEKESIYSLKALKEVRKNGISAELYPDSVKLKKQMNYANKNSIAYVAMAGEEEIMNGTFTLKNMITGEQSEFTIQEIIKTLKENG